MNIATFQRESIIRPDEDLIVQVQKYGGNGADIIIQPRPSQLIRLRREAAFGIGLALLKAAGVTVEEIINRHHAVMEAAARKQ